VSVLGDSPLGRAARYPEQYDARLLYAVDRASQRTLLGFDGALPFGGVDLWTAYELSWLDGSGKPQVAIATFCVPCDSPRLVESKSVKLYLTGFNLTRFDSDSAVRNVLARDLSAAVGASVDVTLAPLDVERAPALADFSGACIDALPIAAVDDVPVPEALAAAGHMRDETLYTRLFRSVCPVTGQPDYACVQIDYRGAPIDRPGLLRYLVSFRRHPGFHEHCVEQIFADIWRRCRPERLSVYARFTRRGGIDINPYRSSDGGRGRPPAYVRTAQQ
jgi:7-cyano-7-deazaguanine reductase